MQPSGPTSAKIMIVGDHPDEASDYRGEPFAGPSGMELSRMLHEAGITRSECFMTYVVHERPPYNPIHPADPMSSWVSLLKNPPKGPHDWTNYRGAWLDPRVSRGILALRTHIELVRPNLIIGLGNTALKALTGNWGVKSWRGSVLPNELGGHACKVVPTYPPNAVLRDWSVRATTVQDLRRAAGESSSPTIKVPNYRFIIRPNFADVLKYLGDLRVRLSKGKVPLSCDIETRAGHIACIGFAQNKIDAICIPWMYGQSPEGYWSPEQEQIIWQGIREVMMHPNVELFGQNFLYDAQYFWRFFLISPKISFDTMVAQHCMFPGQPKALDYLASLYCEQYKFWKDDGKDWNEKLAGEDALWSYNCEDCVRTYEIMEVQKQMLAENPRLTEVYNFQQGRLVPLLFKAMNRGVRADQTNKARFKKEMDLEVLERNKWITEVLGHPVNIKSPKQMQQLFYSDLAQKPVINRATKKITTNDEALTTIRKREPLLTPLVRRVQELRSLGVFTSTFVEAKLDRDQRLRSSFNPSGTDTFRLSSSENAFWSGLNFQNVPKGNEDPDPGDLRLPNVRKLFLPDEGMTMFDGDLDRADLQVVVWEADDEVLRQALTQGVDLHLLNAGSVFEIKELTSERLLDPEFLGYAKKKYGKQRQFAKAWVHGTNYGGKDRTMAATVGITVRENERYRLRWMGEHPGIHAWHIRTEEQINKFRFVENKFGYRYQFFDRIDDALPQGLAWVPQSTVGCVINRIWDQIDRAVPEAEILIQVHDSLVGQVPTTNAEYLLSKIQEASKVTIPYDKPLVIPFGIKSSTISWGHCE